MTSCRHFTFLLTFLLLYAVSFSQETRTVNLIKYTQNEGLSSYYVTKIIKDKFGFIWVGTQEGLDCFDGKTFRHFSRHAPSGQRLGGSFVIDMIEDKYRDLLWVLTAYGDVCAIDLQTRYIRKRITNDSDGKPLAHKWARCLALADNTLWIGGLGLLSGFDIEKNQFLKTAALPATGMQQATCNISALGTDQQQRLWICSDGYGVVVLNKQLIKLQSFTTALGVNDNQVASVRFWDIDFNKQTAFIASNRGLRSFSCEGNIPGLHPIRSGSIQDTAEVYSISATTTGKIFFSTSEAVRSFDPLTQQSLRYRDTESEDDWLGITYNLLYDSVAHRVWVGTQSGLAYFDATISPFTALYKSPVSGIRIKHAFSLLPASEKEIYCGDENGLFLANVVSGNIEQLSSTGSNLLLFRDNEKNIFLSNKSGLHLVHGKSVRPAAGSFPELRPLNADQFNSCVQFNDSLLLFGSVLQKGLSVWNKNSKRVATFHNDSSLNRIPELTIINNLFKSASGKAFILTEKMVIRFDPLNRTSRQFQLINQETGLPILNLMDMCETKDSYWIATYGDGIIHTDKEFRIIKVIDSRDGLSNNCVYKVFGYNDQSVFATTNFGINVIDSRNYHCQTYVESDGLHSSQFEQVCGYQDKRFIYAGGVNGFSIINPALLFVNSSPPDLFLDRIRIQTRNSTTDTTNFLLKHLDIPNDILQVTVSVTGLNLKSPGRVRYAYKIKEDEGNWIDLNDQGFINLPALPPGRYTIMFNAANEAGAWSVKPIELVLNYLPKWYQQFWFKALVVLVAMALLYAFYRFRQLQIRKRDQLKKDIANDLHDDLGSILNSAKIFTHLAQREPEKTDHLHQLEESLSQASLGLRDMIWVLDDAQNTIYEVADRIKKFALPVCLARNVNFHCNVEAGSHPNPRTLSSAEKKNYLLIVKEAITNSLKYAKPENIRVVIGQVNGKNWISIRDDGNGFDPDLHTDGNGLKNMQYRAQQIDSYFSIHSSPGNGTVIHITGA